MSVVELFRDVFQLKIILKGSKPPIWRRIVAPGDTSLDKLHEIIQIAMGWTDSHMHQYICNGTYYCIPYDDDPIVDMVDERGVKINKLLKKEKDKIFYEYDFGDGWLHEITLEKITGAAGKSKVRCLKGVGACPPEDCGGLWGYYDLLEVVKDENNPDYAEMLEWLGEGFDPDFYDLTVTNVVLDKYINKA